MHVEIHHTSRMSPYDDREGETFTHVANVAAPTWESQLEYAWHRTQNIMGSWSRGPVLPNGDFNEDFSTDVSRLVPLPTYLGEEVGLRSSMVGDRFVVVDGDQRRTYEVASVGFKEIG